MQTRGSLIDSNQLRIRLVRPKSCCKLLKPQDSSNFDAGIGKISFPRRDFNLPLKNKDNNEYNLINFNEKKQNDNMKKVDFNDLKSYMKSFSLSDLKKHMETKGVKPKSLKKASLFNTNQHFMSKKIKNDKESYNSERKNKMLNVFLTRNNEENCEEEISRKLMRNSEWKRNQEEKLKIPLKNINFENFKVSKKYSHIKGNMAKTPKIQNLFNISQTQLMILNRKPNKKSLISPCEALQGFYRSMLLDKNSRRNFDGFFEMENDELSIKKC